MGDDDTSKRHDASHDDTISPDEWERQAREAIERIRGRAGEFGSRVRRVIERAGAHWEASAAVPQSGQVPITAGERARTLARRWADIDFLVDPELPAALAVHGMVEGIVWRAEVRERGETRTLDERIESYRGTLPTGDTPKLPVWEYEFPLTPEIEAGERRERVPGTGSVQACGQCGGTGHCDCATCAGTGTEECPRCHGSSQLTCPRCRGRGQIADSKGDRPALHDASHLQVHAERLLNEASERVNFLRERLRNDWQARPPLTASSSAPVPANGTALISCPDCDKGMVACGCDHGRRACHACGGTGHAECTQCKGTGHVVQHREVVRRFDTRIGQRTLPAADDASSWIPDDILARGSVEPVWEGPLDAIVETPRPPQIPEDIWKAALAFAMLHRDAASPTEPAPAEDARRIIGRRLALVRLPLTRVAYTFAEKPYLFVAYGREGAERFWAERFPHRWSRVGRFLRAMSRDLGEPAQSDQPPPGNVSSLLDYRIARGGTFASTEHPPLPHGDTAQSSSDPAQSLPSTGQSDPTPERGTPE